MALQGCVSILSETFTPRVIYSLLKSKCLKKSFCQEVLYWTSFFITKEKIVKEKFL